MRKYVGERIKALREAQDMTLAQVSKLTGIDEERLGAYEEGTAVPAIGAVIQLSRVLGSKMEGLLHGGGTVSESLTLCRAGESLVQPGARMTVVKRDAANVSVRAPANGVFT